MRRIQIGTAVAALLVLASAPWSLQARQGQAPAGRAAMIASLSEPGEGLSIVQSSPSGRAVFASATGQGLLLPVAATDTAADRASVFIDLYGSAFGLAGRSQVRLARAPQRDELGFERVKFQQLHFGVPVTGAEFVVHLKGSRVMAANGRVLDRLPPDVRPAILPVAAQDTARAVIAKYKTARAPGVQYSAPRLEVFNRGFLESKPDDSRLAWFVEATGQGVREFIWVDARTGGRLLNFSQIHTVKDRRVFNANGGATLPGTLARSEGEPATGIVDVDDAYLNSGITYDFFFSNFARDSYNGLGGGIVSSVNWDDGASCPNAFWDGNQMVYCAGFASADDVVGHELTHAVTQYEANLFYFVQSGALNESYSDIFGEAIDLTNVTAGDTPAVRWEMGEDLPIGAVRNMMDPTLFGNPGKMSDTGYFWCDATSDGGGVHGNSGVPNHAFALMVDGGTYNGYAITGIGLTKATKIEYRALSTYLTTSSSFLDNFNALNQSCSDQIGIAGITSADCAQVHNALLAVEMNAQWGCFEFMQATEPAICPAGGSPTYVFQDGFEGTLPAWQVSSTTATNWGLQPFYVFDGAFSTWGANPGSPSDHRMAMPSSVVIPAAGRLMFNHAFDFEADFDGGMVEYSTDGGTNWNEVTFLMIDGGQFYNTSLPTGNGNPLEGRMAFSMTSYGYKKTRVNLQSLSGQSARFRFRIGTDGAVGANGWFVDNVSIYSCTIPAGAPTITVPPVSQSAPAGTTAIFTVTAAGNATLRYQWLKNGSPIAGATTSTLTLPNVHFLDYGFYSVIVSNGVGTATSDGAFLIVFPTAGPTFTKQPLNKTVTVGQTARFSADTLGGGSYQWYVSTDGGGIWTPLTNVAPYGGVTTNTLTITNVTIGLNNNLYRVIATLGGSATSDSAILNVVPANFITNGTFATGDTTGWLTFENPPGNMEQRVNGGVFEWNRAGNSATQATIFQNTGVAVAGTPLEAVFDLGNSSNIRKRVSVLIIDADFSDITVCTFWLAPAAPMSTYRMRTHTTRPWANAAIYFYAASTGTSVTNGGYYQLDNVSLGFNPVGSNVRTDCVDPTTPPPVLPGAADGPTLLTNGTFGTGVLAPWTLFGTITGQVTNGTFEFIKPTGVAPAGVILQATGAATVVNEFLTATFDLGNTSALRKRVTAIVHDNDFSDLAACTFWLPPGMPLSTYQVRMRSTEAWTNATLSIYPATVGLEQWMLLDNASLKRTPGATMQGIECLEPVETIQPPFFKAGAGGSGSRASQGAQPSRASGSGSPLNSRFSRVRASFDDGVPEWTATSDGWRGRQSLRWQRPIDLDGIADGRLSFWSLMPGAAGAGAAEVQVSADGVTWRTLAVVPSGGDWTPVEVDLSEFAGQVFYLQFVYAPAPGDDPGVWRVADVRVTRK